MYDFFGVSRAASYVWLKRLKQPDKDAESVAMTQESWEDSRKTYGYQRISLWIRQHKGIVINHKAVLRLMNKLNIRSLVGKRKPFMKISQLDIYHYYGNLLDRQFTAEKPNQKWVMDIGYIRTTQGWTYLTVIKNLYNGFIVAHKLSRQFSVLLVTHTLKLARLKEKTTDGMLLHSNKGRHISHSYFILTN